MESSYIERMEKAKTLEEVVSLVHEFADLKPSTREQAKTSAPLTKATKRNGDKAC